jgi:hypothetical protein
LNKRTIRENVLSSSSQFHQQFTISFLRQFSFAKKITILNVSTEKLRKTLLYGKAARKMLVKLTPGVNFCVK